LLTKAVTKFPVGIKSRYQKIRDFIGGTKTVQAVINKIKYATVTMVGDTSISHSQQLENQYKKYRETMEKK